MKKLKLQHKSYKVLVANFKDWLDILGYADKSVYGLPIFIQEFLYYLEQYGIYSINNVTRDTIQNYYNYLQQRPNERRGGGLSKSYLNGHQVALKRFKEYLQKHNAVNFPIHLKPESIDRLDVIDIITKEEAQLLFKATDYSHNEERFRLRDKAILTILYSCGLRRTEAVSLNISDILFDKELVLVRKGKNYKERFVPVNTYNLRLLEDYIYDGRIQFKNYNQTEALLIGQLGTRLSGGTMANRLQKIIKATEDKDIIAKKISPHKLRHSIATHFLQAGMNMEDIKQFLGHSHLETTQIYTHLIKKL